MPNQFAVAYPLTKGTWILFDFWILCVLHWMKILLLLMHGNWYAIICAETEYVINLAEYKLSWNNN